MISYHKGQFPGESAQKEDLYKTKRQHQISLHDIITLCTTMIPVERASVIFSCLIGKCPIALLPFRWMTAQNTLT